MNQMEQRDLLKDQIEQLGKVLAKILSDFFGLASKGETSQGIGITNERLKSELDIEIKKIVNLPKEELDDYLKQRQLTSDHLAILSDLLKEIGKGEIDRNKYEAKLMLEKAIELLEIADETSETMSFDRMNKKNEINGVLQQYLKTML